jgi:hypothetical protein
MWKNNIRNDCTAIEWEGVVWIHVAQDMYQWLDFLKKEINILFQENG